MIRVVFLPEATFEVTEAAASYDLTRPGLGRDFLDELDTTLDNLRQFPMSAQRIGDDYRRAVVHRFPFFVVYRVRVDEIRVTAVVPTRANPERLLSKLSR